MTDKKIIFLDRDGVINHDVGYFTDIEKFNFIDGVFRACHHFLNLGYEIIVITNQSGIGRGIICEDDYIKLTKWMISEFKNKNIDILKVYFCPHMPDCDCDCRKPKPGMVYQALNDFKIDLGKSWLIGDKNSDIQTAINANMKNFILITENNKTRDSKLQTLFTARNLLETIQFINK